MINLTNVSWNSAAFYNACTTRSMQQSGKYRCFDQPWYEENYRKKFLITFFFKKEKKISKQEKFWKNVVNFAMHFQQKQLNILMNF